MAEKLSFCVDANAILGFYNGDEASSEQKQLLELIFGKEQLKRKKPANVMDRVRTFADACAELGSDSSLVKAYNNFMDLCDDEEANSDVIAYLQLRIIVAALNEGWQPKFVSGEYRYYPWYYLYTKEEIDNMNDDDKRRVVGRASDYASADGGLVCANACFASSLSGSYVGARLAYCSEALAEYAGKQFAAIYAKFIFGTTEIVTFGDEAENVSDSEE